MDVLSAKIFYSHMATQWRHYKVVRRCGAHRSLVGWVHLVGGLADLHWGPIFFQVRKAGEQTRGGGASTLAEGPSTCGLPDGTGLPHPG